MTAVNIGDVITLETDLSAVRTVQISIPILNPDGSREIVGYITPRPGKVISTYYESTLAELNKRYGSIVMLYWGPFDSKRVHSGEYLPYLKPVDNNDPNADRRLDSQADPVNQVPYANEVEGHIARFAHNLDIFRGTFSAEDAGTSKTDIVRNHFESSIGYVQGKLDTWRGFDPDPNTSSLPTLWKDTQPVFKKEVELLCDECDQPHYPREFVTKADLDAFNANYNSGKLTGIDKSTTPWSPSSTVLTQVAILPDMTELERTEEIQRFFAINRADYIKARDIYDTKIGPRELPHEH